MSKLYAVWELRGLSGERVLRAHAYYVGCSTKANCNQVLLDIVMAHTPESAIDQAVTNQEQAA